MSLVDGVGWRLDVIDQISIFEGRTPSYSMDLSSLLASAETQFRANGLREQPRIDQVNLPLLPWKLVVWPLVRRGNTAVPELHRHTRSESRMVTGHKNACC